jgi:hypothetical protein
LPNRKVGRGALANDGRPGPCMPPRGAKPKPRDTKPGPLDAKPDPLDTKPDPLDTKLDPLDAKPDPLDAKPPLIRAPPPRCPQLNTGTRTRRHAVNNLEPRINVL